MNRVDFDYLLDEIRTLKREIRSLREEEIPEFKFALREDLKDELKFLPTRAELLSTGYDVRAAPEDRKDIILKPGQYFKIPLGFRALCPDGWWYQLHPRSSSFAKKNMHCLIGTVDESWEGYTAFAGQYLPDSTLLLKDLVIKFGDPIAQIIPVKRQSMIVKNTLNDELDSSFEKRGALRKDGGFGSTDLKNEK
jgi:dUTPase